MSDDHVTLADDPGDDPGRHSPDAEPAAEAPSQATGHACTECGAHIDLDQQYCLECGAPTPHAVPLRSRRSGPALIAASLLALGIGGASVIYAATREDATSPIGSVPTGTGPTTGLPLPTTGSNPFPTDGTLTFPTFPTTPTTSPTFTTSPTTPSTITSFSTFTTTVTTTVTTRTGPTTSTGGGVDDWQYFGETRWTVVMRSFEDQLDAEDHCEGLLDKNLSCGVLNSSDYSSLREGYFVVFHGAYTTKAGADRELNRIKGSYPQAYVRKVEV